MQKLIWRHREEAFGSITYNFLSDQFLAHVDKERKVIIPKSPIGVGWIIIGSCNLKCIHCYGNQESLPKEIISTSTALAICDKLIAAEVMRVVISGGEPLLRPDINIIIEHLVKGGISVVLGTNGAFIDERNIPALKLCTRVEISLDAHTPELNDKIRPSRQKRGSAWLETMTAITALKSNQIPFRVLTAINAINQKHISGIAAVLDSCEVNDWALSWTVPAGRALPIYGDLKPSASIIESEINEVKKRYPHIHTRYSDRVSNNFSRFYFLILPNGNVATEDFDIGQKVQFGSLTANDIDVLWNSTNFNQIQHFQKWIGNRKY